MRCCRCGAQAVDTRDQQYYCGRCALAHDWEEIIAIAQEVGGPLPPLPVVGPPEGGRLTTAA